MNIYCFKISTFLYECTQDAYNNIDFYFFWYGWCLVYICVYIWHRTQINALNRSISNQNNYLVDIRMEDKQISSIFFVSSELSFIYSESHRFKSTSTALRQYIFNVPIIIITGNVSGIQLCCPHGATSCSNLNIFG